MHRRKLGLLPTAPLLLVLALALAACGQTRTTLAGNPNTTARLRATASTTRAGSPTSVGMPYSFNSAWHLQHGAPSNLNTFVFAASQPSVGYGCVGGTGNPPTSASGPPLLVTHDGGATWTPTGGYPLGTTQCQVFSDPADANDIFVVEPSNYAGFSQGQATYTPDAWRSRDGGTTWNKLAAIMLKQTPVGISNLAVIGSRLVASVVPQVPSIGAIWDDLVASDDGGATWQQIGESMKPNGQIGTFVTAGTTLFASVQPGCTPCTYIDSAQRLPARSVPSRPWLMAPASSFSTNSYYRSTDAGATWTKVDGLPANANLHGLSFAPSQPHQGSYVGVAITQTIDLGNGVTTALYYTVDTGQTWRPVPSFEGAGSGWPDPRSLGANNQLTVLPNQAMFVGTSHDFLSNGGQPSESGIFRLGLEASGEWLPYAPNSVSGADGSTAYVDEWQVVPNGSGWRIWGLAFGSAASSGLAYLDAS